MVKVISAYNFQQQDTYPASGDIAATCLIGSSRLVIAHRSHLIEIFTLKRRQQTAGRKQPKNNATEESQQCYIDQNDNCQPTKIAFPTIDQVHQLHYCAAGNYLLTLEQKSIAELSSGGRQQRQTFVRAYTNFDIAGSVDDCFSVPIRARIAAKTTPNVTCSDHIEVIEIPVGQDDGMPEEGVAMPPHLITCCQTSGTVAVCCNEQIRFYECKRRTNDTNKFQFIDFIEAPFYVRLDFVPCKLSLAEHVVACMDRAIVVAFKIVDLGDTGTEDGTTTNSMETDSSANLMNRPNQSTAPGTDGRRAGAGYSSNFKRNRTIDFEVAKQYKQANGIRFQTDIRSNWDHENGRRSSAFAEDRPYLVNDVKIVLKSTREHIPSNDRIFYSLRSLVQLRLHQQQQQNMMSGGSLDQGVTTNTIHDEFRCLALKPIYFKLNQASGDGDQEALFKDDSSYSASYDLDADSGHVMKSSYHRNCIGFTLFISTVSDGYVYQFTNQGKWYAENTKCLAVYPFTSPVVDVVIDSYVIHAITESGIETFSSRIGHKLFSSYFEYPMISDPYPNETSPLVDVPICVMGICGFFGIRHVAASATNLVLLTTDLEPARKSNGNHGARRIGGSAAGTGAITQNSRRNNGYHTNQSSGGQNNNTATSEILDWTIYDLELPQPEQLVDDIENLACIYRQSSPEIYYELIEEAHVIIRLARELFFIPTCYGPRRLPAEQEMHRSTLDRSYMKTCKMLADFTIQSNRKETYSQAVAYYSMCKHSIQDIYSSYRQNQPPTTSNNHDGLMYTLTLILSNIGANKSAIEYLTQTLPVSGSGNITPPPHGSETVIQDRTCAEELFDLFEKYSPNDLIHVALNSSVFREILYNRFQQLFANTPAEKLSPERKMCHVLCLCYQNKHGQARVVFETTRRCQVYAVLRDYWSQILFDNFRADNYRKCSFSDLTECILFVTERTELMEAVADVLVQILIVTRTIDLSFVIKLFMNYFAMNVGCPGYRTSQRILEIVLQAYFYDFYKYSHRNAIALGQELHETHDDNFGLVTEYIQAMDLNAAHGGTSPGGEKTIVAGMDFSKWQQQRQRQNSIHQQLSDHSSASTTTVESNYDDPEFEAMKILFRMYLGLLKQYTTDNNVASRNSRWTNGQDVAAILPDINAYRLAFIDYLSRNVTAIKLNHSKFDSNTLTTQQLQQQMAPILPDYDAIAGCVRGGDSGDEAEYFRGTRSFRRPIVFFERRENFLNKMSPLCLKTDVNGVPFSNNWDEISLVVIKLQSLLNSGKLDGSLISDLIIFINSNPNVIGVDSLLTLLLPKPEAIEFLIHTNPQYLLDYAKARLTTSNQWQVLFKRILSKKRELNAETQQSAIELFDRIIEDILRYLVNTKSLDEFLDCIPEQEISRHEQHDSNQPYSGHFDAGISSGASSGSPSGDHVENVIKDNSYWKAGKYRLHTQDGINETNPFELIMREAVIKQRSDALDAMIQSSGRQLNDAVNFQLNLN